MIKVSSAELQNSDKSNLILTWNCCKTLFEHEKQIFPHFLHVMYLYNSEHWQKLAYQNKASVEEQLGRFLLKKVPFVLCWYFKACFGKSNILKYYLASTHEKHKSRNGLKQIGIFFKTTTKALVFYWNVLKKETMLVFPNFSYIKALLLQISLPKW